MVGDFDHILVMFHEDDGVAMTLEFPYRVLHQQDVVIVKAHAGFVEDVHHIGERRVDVFGDLAALCLAA